LGAEDRRHRGSASYQQPEKDSEDDCDTEPAREASLFEPICTLSERKAEQDAKEEQEDDRVRYPEQPKEDVEAEYDPEKAHDIPCWEPDRFT